MVNQALVHFYSEAPKRFSRFRQYLGSLANIIGILREIKTAQEIIYEMELHKVQRSYAAGPLNGINRSMALETSFF